VELPENKKKTLSAAVVFLEETVRRTVGGSSGGRGGERKFQKRQKGGKMAKTRKRGRALENSSNWDCSWGITLSVQILEDRGGEKGIGGVGQRKRSDPHQAKQVFARRTCPIPCRTQSQREKKRHGEKSGGKQ